VTDVNPPLYIVGLGASTPVGRDAWATAAAVRAGISGFVEHPYAMDAAGERVRLAIAPWLDPEYGGEARFEALLFPAIEQAIAPLSDLARADSRTALVLGLPPERPGLPKGLDRHLKARVGEVFRDRFAAIGTFAVGHAAGLIGLEAALTTSAGTFDSYVVAGVESYLAADTLEWLEDNERLHGAGRLNNAWGFVPGEGAGAVLLADRRISERMRPPYLGSVESIATARERNLPQTETVCIGEGLTTAFGGALAALPPDGQVTDVVCDMNGEPYRADEFGFACLRTGEAFASPSDFVAPADCWGDVSAAFVPLALVLSTIASSKGYAKGQYSLVWASSDTGERGAALLQYAVPERV
jgi:3-oxoacyl-[acyl-carrier-protein] synthase I